MMFVEEIPCAHGDLRLRRRAFQPSRASTAA
jgi:hypothetical protein